MRKSGLALGGSLENAVVIGETGVLNNSCASTTSSSATRSSTRSGTSRSSATRCSAGSRRSRAGHALHAALAQKLLATPGRLRPRPRRRAAPGRVPSPPSRSRAAVLRPADARRAYPVTSGASLKPARRDDLGADLDRQ